ncbi:MAG TPA: glycerol-3-phosphate 1-O-acyltransferase PlsY [Candidatus Limnocylindria bacterium]|nr:glycerol-3-phosphate 1-O-acyltransferase PlsY [Candidatus Limnocylindria bacterium]
MLPQPVLDLLFVAIGYLSGSLPMGVIVARLTGAPDPRTIGSGRTGGTNALRAMGARRALAVGALDVAKGALPVAAAVLVGASPLGVALTGAAAVLGAWRSVFLRFHGGRGVATGIGGLLVIQPLAVLLGAPFFLGLIAVTRYVSLGSLLGTVAAVALLAVFIWLGMNDPAHLWFGVLAGGLVWLAHWDNIGRLVRGEERRIDFRARGDG